MRDLRPNYERYPDNIFESETTEKGEIIYLARFKNLYDLYDYLASEPNINEKVFRELASINGDYSFAGKPYEDALKDLIKSETDSGYTEFLRLQKGLENCINIPIHKYKTVKTLAGGHLNVPAYSAGNPLCYETEERIIRPKFVTIDVLLNYLSDTSKSQVFNRAIIITNILKALENAGYSINLNTFSLSGCSNEYIHVVFEVKNYGEKLNMDVLYKVLCHVEFLRRIIFRIRETIDVKDYEWGRGYGRTCNKGVVKRILNFGDSDIYFDQPDSMGIRGYDLGEDFENAIDRINIADKLDVETAKIKFKEEAKKLTLRR